MPLIRVELFDCLRRKVGIRGSGSPPRKNP
jgi:hypothetical protein